MKIKLKTILKHIMIPVIFGIIIGNLLTIFFNWENLFSWHNFLEMSFYSSILTLFFWKGNEAIIRYLNINQKNSWINNSWKVAVKHAILLFIYSVSVIFVFYLYDWFFLMHRKTLHGFYNNFKFGFYVCFSITAIVTLISYSYYFLKYWKRSVLNEERLKRESLALEYESLKNQVNPHFLFNSLNILTSLIEKDTAASINYVKQLSNVFRYVLEQNTKELVPAITELTFIEAYLYLHKIRFGESFKVSVNITNQRFNIVPMTLQILIENAVKHNEISSEKPLSIEISDDTDYLIVKNNFQKRNYLPESNLVGLKSLQFQYSYLSGKNLEIINDGENFVVKVPKIS